MASRTVSMDRAVAITVSPASSAARVISRPTPRLAPVTSQTLPIPSSLSLTRFSPTLRKTRSVAPTAAGERLLATLSLALAGLDDEIEALSQARGAAIGTVRITTGKHAADTVLWPMLPSFMRRHPGIEVEVCVEGGMTDVVTGRYDARIRLGERL